VTDGPPDGTRYVPPDRAALRSDIAARLADLYAGWGYVPVEVPALERYRPDHPRSGQSFKLSDRDSGVLALRSDFTPALAGLVLSDHPEVAAGAIRPLRLRYRGTVWHAIDPELSRTREFTQIGIELVGVSNARADAELIHLARESVRAVGLTPRVEVGNPGFVRALFDAGNVPERLRAALADAIDRKDRAELERRLAPLTLEPALRRALLEVPDLYGDVGVLDEALAAAPHPGAVRELDRLAGVLSEFEDDSELLLDLGMARRLSYYTGVTFRAYTFDYGQPLLGGGRYDGALLPYAAGFSIGLERLVEALPTSSAPTAPVLSLDDVGARRLRAAGFTVVRALTSDPAEARSEARALGIPYLLSDRLEAIGADTAERTALQAALDGVDDGL
jgi:ATP phosphoribosyltransferase regulatory subunit